MVVFTVGYFVLIERASLGLPEAASPLLLDL
jgi:hypothetical protein